MVEAHRYDALVAGLFSLLVLVYFLFVELLELLGSEVVQLVFRVVVLAVRRSRKAQVPQIDVLIRHPIVIQLADQISLLLWR